MKWDRADQVLPPDYSDSRARADGYTDRAEAIQDAIVNGWAEKEWERYYRG